MAAAVRPARSTDADALAGLVERYWEFERIQGFDHARIATLLAELLEHSERGAAWIAEDAGQPVGYLLAVHVWSLEHGGLMAEVDEFFVLPEWRSRGVGQMLLARAERDLTAAGLVRLQLQLAPDNRRGQAFYERHGFDVRPYTLLDKPLERR